jgi:hypothetical protein
VLATIRRLLRGERERLRTWIVKLGFDREYHTPQPATINFHGRPWATSNEQLSDAQSSRPERLFGSSLRALIESKTTLVHGL